MDNSRIKNIINENRYLGDPLFSEFQEGDTVYSIVAFTNRNNPSVFACQDRNNRSSIYKLLDDWKDRHKNDLLVVMKFDLKETDPDKDLPLSPVNIEILERHERDS